MNDASVLIRWIFRVLNILYRRPSMERIQVWVDEKAFDHNHVERSLCIPRMSFSPSTSIQI